MPAVGWLAGWRAGCQPDLHNYDGPPRKGRGGVHLGVTLSLAWVCCMSQAERPHISASSRWDYLSWREEEKFGCMPSTRNNGR